MREIQSFFLETRQNDNIIFIIFIIGNFTLHFTQLDKNFFKCRLLRQQQVFGVTIVFQAGNFDDFSCCGVFFSLCLDVERDPYLGSERREKCGIYIPLSDSGEIAENF